MSEFRGSVFRMQASLDSSNVLGEDFDIPLRIDWENEQTFLALKS